MILRKVSTHQKKVLLSSAVGRKFYCLYSHVRVESIPTIRGVHPLPPITFCWHCNRWLWIFPPSPILCWKRRTIIYFVRWIRTIETSYAISPYLPWVRVLEGRGLGISIWHFYRMSRGKGDRHIVNFVCVEKFRRRIPFPFPKFILQRSHLRLALAFCVIKMTLTGIEPVTSLAICFKTDRFLKIFPFQISTNISWSPNLLSTARWVMNNLRDRSP